MPEGLIEQEMTFKKETKHTVVYEDDSEGAAVTSIYVGKAKLPRPFPAKIQLTIEPR